MEIVASDEYFYEHDGQELVGRAQAVELSRDDRRYEAVMRLQLRRQPGDAETLSRRARDGDRRAETLLKMLSLGHPLAWWLASHPNLVVSFALPGIPPSSVSLEHWRDRDPHATLLRAGTVSVSRAAYDASVARGEDPFASTLRPEQPSA